MADLTVKLEGIAELKRALAEASDTIRTKAVRGALREAGKVIQAAARAAVPVMSGATKYRNPGTVKRAISVRSSKYARQDGNEGVFIGVRPLTAKKTRAAKRAQLASGGKVGGAYNPNDPYYWVWLEFGHRIVPRSAQSGSGGGVTQWMHRLRNGKMQLRQKNWSAASITGRRRNVIRNVAPRPFLRPAAAKGEEAISRFMKSVIPQIEKLNKKSGTK